MNSFDNAAVVLCTTSTITFQYTSCTFIEKSSAGILFLTLKDGRTFFSTGCSIGNFWNSFWGHRFQQSVMNDWTTFYLLKSAEIWAQAKSLPSSANWKPAGRGAWEIKSGSKTKRLCCRPLPSNGSEADWCKDKWYYEKRLAYFKRSVACLWGLTLDGYYLSWQALAMLQQSICLFELCCWESQAVGKTSSWVYWFNQLVSESRWWRF